MTGDRIAEAAWYYAQGGQQAGPVTLDALRGLVSSGGLRAGELVWTDGMPQWSPAGEVPALAESFASAPPSQSPPPLPSPGVAAPYSGAYGQGVPLSYQGAPPPGYAGGPGIGDDAGMRWLIPVGRSGWAIAAGYLGLFSFLVLPAPIALVVSIIAIRDIRAHPHRHGMGRAIFGLVMGILGTLWLAVMAVSLAVSA